MAYFKVTKTMQYTETVYVEADDECEAKELALSCEGHQNNDDVVYDEETKEITRDKYIEETE